MKRGISLASSIVLMLSFSAVKAAAQACFSFQPDFGVYVEESSDGTKIYTSIVLEGTGDMTVNNNGSPFCNIGSASHTPLTTNVLGSTGGASQGLAACPDCYLYSSNDQSIVATPGTDYDFTWSADVDCTIAGQFFAVGASVTIRLGASNLQYQSVTNGICTYALSCPNGNNNASCYSGPLSASAPCPYEYFNAGYIVVQINKSNKQCFGAGKATFSNVAILCK